MQLITDTISSTRLGKPKTFRNLTIFPVFGKGIAPDYITLDEALTNKPAKHRDGRKLRELQTPAFIAPPAAPGRWEFRPGCDRTRRPG